MGRNKKDEAIAKLREKIGGASEVRVPRVHNLIVMQLTNVALHEDCTVGSIAKKAFKHYLETIDPSIKNRNVS